MGHPPPHIRTEGGFLLDYCGETISTHPIVAHTYGDLLVYFEESNILFMGDTFTNTYYPSGYAHGRLSEIESVETAKSLANETTIIVPGHGPIDNTAGLDRYLGLVNQWYERLATLVSSASAIEDMINDPVLLRLSDAFLEDVNPTFNVAERLERYIRRTISTDFYQRFPLLEGEMEKYVGLYRITDGAMIEVALEDGIMLMKQEGGFIEELIPLGRNQFHIRGALDGGVMFFNDDSIVQGLTIRSQDIELVGQKTF